MCVYVGAASATALHCLQHNFCHKPIKIYSLRGGPHTYECGYKYIHRYLGVYRGVPIKNFSRADNKQFVQLETNTNTINECYSFMGGGVND